MARLAREGLSNPEIGTRLFISPRTAQYHLSDVSARSMPSRSQLDRVLPADRDTAGPRYPLPPGSAQPSPCEILDLPGPVCMAPELGVEPSRIDTIVNFEAVARYGVNAEGNAAASTASVLAELAGLIAAGELELPIAATFPLDRVQDAYRRLAEGHVLGKIVLLP